MIAVIGDIHGCFYTLKTLVEKLRNKYPEIPIYCVGDLVDRGNNSFEVLEYVKSEKIIFTLGNHDYMFYCSIKEPESLMAKSWRYNGAETTIASYLNNNEKLDHHLDFLKSAPLFLNLDDCFISHAGISRSFKDRLPENFLERESELENILKEDLFDQNSIIWARGPLLNIGKLQIIGHTHRKEIHFDKEANALYIDTTAYGNNKLTAVIVDKNQYVNKFEHNTDEKDLNRDWIYQL
jgi:serine/threonine protein phosphatase 1